MLPKLGSLQQCLPRLVTYATQLPSKRRAFGIALLFGLAYAGLYGPPKHVTFSYAAPTCTGQLTLLPSIDHTVNSSKFNLEYRGGITVGGLNLAATQVCFIPSDSPAKATFRVASAPLGGWAFRSRYVVVVGEAPQVLKAVPRAQTLSRPLAIKLNQPDEVFQYSLSEGINEQPCNLKAAQLLCPVDRLGLKQGASYELNLQRAYHGKSTGAPTGIPIAILPDAKVTATSITPGDIIYTRPKSANITLDHTLTSADAKLEQMDGDKTLPVTIREPGWTALTSCWSGIRILHERRPSSSLLRLPLPPTAVRWTALTT